jgi:1,4-dihydroxy-2-naphthoate octaprenyltransferase
MPVAVGLAAAARSGSIDVPVATATLLAALLLQVAANLANDYADAFTGVDSGARIGPTRVTQAGLIDAPAVKRATIGVIAVALSLGIYLATVGGWPIVAIGLVSALMAVAYSAGPLPLAWYGLGEALAFTFFGLVAVGGTFFLQRGQLDATALLVSLPPACLAAALMAVNNLRDRDSDRQAGKRTVAVVSGDRGARIFYAALVLSAFAVMPLIARAAGAWALLPLASLPLAVVEIARAWHRRHAELNESLAGTARLQVVVGLLLALGLLL